MPMRTVLGFVAYVADSGTGTPVILKGAQGKVYSSNDVGLTTPLSCRDMTTEAVIPNPVSNADGYVGGFKVSISDTADGVLWVSGGYSVYQPFLGVRGAKGDPGPKGDKGGLDAGGLEIVNASATDSAAARQAAQSVVDRANAGEFDGRDGSNVLPTDTAIAQAIGTESATRAALRKREAVLNVRDYGAKGDGATDDSAAINAANSAAFTAGARLFFPPATYRINSIVNLTAQCDAGGATFIYYGTGVAVRVGRDAAVTHQSEFVLPHLNYLSLSGTAPWVADTVGFELVNLNTCKVKHLGRVRGFHYGYRFIGKGAGFAYNEIHLGYSVQNRVAYHLTQDLTGWCNENTFISGRIQLSAGNGAVADDMGAHYVLMDSPTGATASAPNNNRFFGCSFEGINLSYYRLKMVSARYNTFYGCRWEDYGSTYRISYTQGATSNIIHYGYDAWRLKIETDSTSTGNIVYDGQGTKAQGRSYGTQTIPDNTETVLNKWGSLVLDRAAYDAVTGKFTPPAGEWKIDATVMFAANGVGTRNAQLMVGEPGGVETRINADERQGGAAGLTSLKLSGRWRFTGAQQFWIKVKQTSGADLGIYGYTGNTTIYADMLNV